MNKTLTWKNRYKIHYIYTANTTKPCLVLLHGFCENQSIFQNQLSDLQSEFNIIIPDLPGHGASDTIENISIEEMAEIVNNIILSEKIQDIVLCGHSMGGYVAMAYTELFPDTLKGLGLLFSTPIADSDEKKLNRLKSYDFVKENGTVAFTKVLIPTLFAKNFLKSEIINEITLSAGNTPKEGIMSATLAMKNRVDRSDILKQFSKPKLIAAGIHDQVIPYQILQELSLNLTNIHFKTFENSAHMGMIEEPNQMTQVLQEFVTICNLQ